MTMKCKMIVYFAVVILTAAGSLPVRAANNTETGTSSTVTHIEYNAPVFIKTELPRISRPAKASAGGSLGLDCVAFGPLFSLHLNWTGNYTVIRTGVLNIPFFQINLFEDGTDSDRRKDIPGLDEKQKVEKGKIRKKKKQPESSTLFSDNPFRPNGPDAHYDHMFLDAQLISLYDRTTILDTRGRKNSLEKAPVLARRSRFLDSLVFGLYRQDRWSGNKYDLELFYTRLTIGFPFDGALVTKSHVHDRRTLSVLGAFGVKNEQPALALWLSQQKDGGACISQALRIPFLGPIWAAWRDARTSETHQTILPRLLFWKQFPAEAQCGSLL